MLWGVRYSAIATDHQSYEHNFWLKQGRAGMTFLSLGTGMLNSVYKIWDREGNGKRNCQTGNHWLKIFLYFLLLRFQTSMTTSWSVFRNYSCKLSIRLSDHTAVHLKIRKSLKAIEPRGVSHLWRWGAAPWDLQVRAAPLEVPWRRPSRSEVRQPLISQGDKLWDQNFQVYVVSRPLRPKRAIPHPITMQNMRFRR